MSKTNQKLENLNIETLDLFEQTIFYDYLQHMDKPEALQKIIENCQGDFTQLSEQLSEIAQEQES